MDNFNLSIILPFYKKLDVFKKVLNKNSFYLQRNGIEVIIVMDEPSEQNGILKLLKYYPFINWKVIVNKAIHDWRNPAKVLNVGIKHATKDYIMIISPESEFYNDAIIKLKTTLDIYGKCFVIGKIAFEYFDTKVNEYNINNLSFTPYGSIMVKKEYLFDIGGYSEEYLEWGGDDDNIRARLQYFGIRKIYLDNAILIHRETPPNDNVRTDFDKSTIKHKRIETIKHLRKSIIDKKEIYYPNTFRVNKNKWGEDFGNIIFDWQNKNNSNEMCVNFLLQFQKFIIKEEYVFKKNYKVIALVQMYNESSTINNFLCHLYNYCDGIILLDDGSTDNSFNISNNDKILIKLQKTRIGFNDSENRNILLNVASFIKSDWFYFIDVDERFVEKYSDIYSILDRSVDSVLFNFIHLWDSDNKYRIDYPYSKNGIQPHWRMFRNIGRMQINTNKILHFHSIPYIGRSLQSKILIKHYGLLTKEQRKAKYNFYKKADKQNDQLSYEHLIDENIKTDLVENITL